MGHTTGCPTNENVSTAHTEGTAVIFKIMKFYVGNAILISGKNSAFCVLIIQMFCSLNYSLNLLKQGSPLSPPHKSR